MSAQEPTGEAIGLRGRLVRGMAGSFVVVAASRILSLAAAVLLARLLSPSGYGAFATAIALVTVLGVPTMAGLPTMLVRFVADYDLHRDLALMRGLLRWSASLALVITFGIGGLSAVVVLLVRPSLAGGLAPVLLLSLLLLPLSSFIALQSATLRGLRYVVLGQLPLGIISQAVFVVFLLSWAFLTQDSMPITASMAMVGRIACAAMALAAGTWLLGSRLPRDVRAVQPRADIHRWLNSAKPLLLLGGLQVINDRTDILMLSMLKGTAVTGIYQAAARGAELAVFGLVVVNLAIQPTVARLHAAGDLARLQRVATAGARLSTAAALPTALAFITFGGTILRHVFGSQYAGGAVVLSVLAAAQVVNAAMGSVNLILNMTGHERLAAQGMAIGAIANILLNLALIPLWGAIGAAAATASSLVVWNFVQGVHVRRRLGLRPSIMGASRFGA